MKYYVELHSRKNGQILGNLDGQGVMDCKVYTRTNYYKSLPERLERAKKFYKDDGLFYQIVSVGGTLLETIE